MFSDREAAFPLDLADQALTIEVHLSESSYPEDRISILNKITGTPLDAVPETEHENFDRLNHSLRANFAMSSLAGVEILCRFAVVKYVYFISLDLLLGCF